RGYWWGLVDVGVRGRFDGPEVAPSRYSSRELFCLSGTDRPLGAVLPVGRETFSGATFSDFGAADLRLVSRQRLDRGQATGDNDLARHRRVGHPRACLYWIALCDSAAPAAPRDAD